MPFSKFCINCFFGYIVSFSAFYERVGDKKYFLVLFACATRGFGQPSLEILRHCMSSDYHMIDLTIL